MKKCTALIAALALMLSLCACAMGEINLTKRQLSQAEGLDKNVSHILLVLQDGERTDTLMLASINSKTGRAVMTQVSCERAVDVTMEDGGARAMPLSDVYALGGKKSRGLLVCRELNELLGLNIGTYVVLDMAKLSALVDAVGVLSLELTQEEAAALARPEGRNELTGDEVLDYVRLHLEDGDASRSYEALMQLLYQGMNSGNLMTLVSMGVKMLGSMDTNMGAMMAVPLVTAVMSGEDRREVTIGADEPATEAEVQALIHREIYE